MSDGRAATMAGSFWVSALGPANWRVCNALAAADTQIGGLTALHASYSLSGCSSSRRHPHSSPGTQTRSRPCVHRGGLCLPHRVFLYGCPIDWLRCAGSSGATSLTGTLLFGRTAHRLFTWNPFQTPWLISGSSCTSRASREGLSIAARHHARRAAATGGPSSSRSRHSLSSVTGFLSCSDCCSSSIRSSRPTAGRGS